MLHFILFFYMFLNVVWCNSDCENIQLYQLIFIHLFYVCCF